LGRREGVTVSLDSAIMAPSLNTASSTIRMVGKYLRGQSVHGEHGEISRQIQK
jgi:hypothetical protein